jgi:acetyl/propionyl-CoA carboxylase alpha subunit
MNPSVRAAMGQVACTAARAVDYVGAATVEFLFEEQPDGQPRFYFLEMNTRLQVEHPVTELTTGRDLVWDMIRVAAGEPLGYSQAEVPPSGHAIECRIYAEDASRFLPSPGPLTVLRWPEGPNLRIDAAVREGSEVSSHYDPMIAKLCAWGRTRAEAIERMRRALEDTVILGIDCNLGFHLRVLAEPDFRAGHFTTRYIEEHPELVAAHVHSEADSRAIAAAAAALATHARGSARTSAAPAPASVSRWQSSVRWRA